MNEHGLSTHILEVVVLPSRTDALLRVHRTRQLRQGQLGVGRACKYMVQIVIDGIRAS